MKITAYKDFEGNYIDSDYVIFEENSEDIIDDTYIKSDWHRDPEKIYIEIIEENTKYYDDYIKGKF